MKELQKQINDIEGFISDLARNAYNKGYEDGLNIRRESYLLPKLPYGLDYADGVDCLELSVRALNCLRRRGIKTIKDLTEVTVGDVMKIRNMGGHTMEEMLNILHTKYGIYLKGEARDDSKDR